METSATKQTDINFTINVRDDGSKTIKQNSTFEVTEQGSNGNCGKINDIFNRVHRFYYNHTSRPVRNTLRVGVAVVISFSGGAIAGDPRIVTAIGALWAVYLGAALSGIGNGVSTYLFLETDIDDRIPLLERQVKDLTSQVTTLNEFLKHFDPKLLTDKV